MLVIRRRPGETILLGEDIEIEVLDAGPSSVKLGIRAPKSVAVVRKEIKVVGEQNRAASREVSPGRLDRVLSTLRQSGVPAPSNNSPTGR